MDCPREKLRKTFGSIGGEPQVDSAKRTCGRRGVVAEEVEAGGSGRESKIGRGLECPLTATARTDPPAIFAPPPNSECSRG